MTSAFDPQSFLNAQITEVNEKRPLIPADNPETPDGMYTAVIGEIKDTKSGTIGKGDKTGQPWLSVQVPLRIQLPPSVQAMGLPAEFQFTDGVFIDLTPTGAVDNGKGKNARQRIYRDATGTNVSGEPFAWRMLQGKVVKVKIVHKPYNDSFVENIGMLLPA